MGLWSRERLEAFLDRKLPTELDIKTKGDEVPVSEPPRSGMIPSRGSLNFGRYRGISKSDL